MVVGCSIQFPDGIIMDVPARLLNSPGLALWDVDAPDACAVRITGTAEIAHWKGRIIFALWPDFAFRTRLTDTGWVDWRAPWLMGHSLAGVKAQEDEIQSTYGHRLDIWLERGAATRS